VRDRKGGTKTMDGMVAGTPNYMPPEQAKGNVYDVDERSDIYSLGAILYETLALHPPYRGDDVQRLIEDVIAEKVTPLEKTIHGKDVPKELVAVCKKAMSYEKKHRYARVGELSHDIRLFLEGRAVSAKEDTFFESARKLIKREKKIFATAGIAFLLLVALSVLGINRIITERNAALDSLEKFFVEREGRYAERKTSAPKFLARAAELIEGEAFKGGLENFKAALKEVATAIEYDPALAKAHLMRGQLLVVLGEYTEAAAALGRYLEFGADGDSATMKEIAEGVPEGSELDTEKRGELFAIFTRQKAYQFAKAMAQSAEQLAELYQKKIKNAWGRRASLRPSPQRDGTFHLRIAYRKDISDISPLRGIPLSHLDILATKVADLSPIKDMPLKSISMSSTKVADLGPLRGKQLTALNLNCCANVSDISPLKGMPLTIRI